MAQTTAQPESQQPLPLGCVFTLLLLAGGMIGGFLWSKAAREQRQAEAEQKQFEEAWNNPAGPFTADQLCLAYENNPVPFEQAKGSGVVIVSGSVNSIRIDWQGEAIVALGAGLVGGVGCSFEKDEEDNVAKLKKGQLVTVKGLMQGGDVTGQVQLSRCRFVTEKTRQKRPDR